MTKVFTFVVALMALIQEALGRSSPSPFGNGVAMYWGQNSVNQEGGQERLSYYCKSTDVDIFLVAFIPDLRNLHALNFANQEAKFVEEDIKECQKLGKIVMPSFGGEITDFNGWTSPAEAKQAAHEVFEALGPLGDSSTKRPFGSAIVDGFDIDYESPMENILAFTKELESLRDLSDLNGGKYLYMTLAPQCVYPDRALGPLLSSDIRVDAVMIQFYNNPTCGADSFVTGLEEQPKFNFKVWQEWAERSANPDVKLLLGLPAAPGAVGEAGGYVPGDKVAEIIAYCKRFNNFGGAMIWDASQTWSNAGFLTTLRAALGGANEQTGGTSSLPKENSSITDGKKDKATDQYKNQEPSDPTKPVPSPPSPTTLSSVTTKPQPTLTLPTTSESCEKPTATNYLEAAKPVESGVPLPPAAGKYLQPGVWIESPAGYVRQWNQCDGDDWNGGRICEKPYVCKYFTNWYSQCE